MPSGLSWPLAGTQTAPHTSSPASPPVGQSRIRDTTRDATRGHLPKAAVLPSCPGGRWRAHSCQRELCSVCSLPPLACGAPGWPADGGCAAPRRGLPGWEERWGRCPMAEWTEVVRSSGWPSYAGVGVPRETRYTANPSVEIKQF